jgi:hypothetical protein
MMIIKLFDLPSSLLIFGWLIVMSGPSFAQTPTPLASSAAQMSSPMTNEDIVKMSKMGFANDVIKAKIQEVGAVDFRLEVDDLSKLKSAGVSQDVISAMLTRSTARTNAPKDAQPARNSVPTFVAGAGIPTMSDVGTVKLLTRDHAELELRSSAGNISTTYAFVTMLVYCNYPGLKADARIQDPRPTLLVKSGKSPKGRLYLVSASVDHRNGVRSVKLGNAGFGRAKNIGAPDSDNQVEYDVVAETADTWRLIPTKDLRPGEYGLWDQMQEMYDFGIDP